MDAAVIAAMAKWPNVPAVYGWLALTARGEWRLKGERLAHAGLTEFFSRNYESDERGCYFVQNGPQRIFVALQAAPYAARREESGWRRVPDGLVAVAEAAYITSAGELFLQLGGALALVDDRDWLRLSEMLMDEHGAPLDDSGLEALCDGQGRAYLQLAEGKLPLQAAGADELRARYGVQLAPHAD